jgi:DNA polymerase/3'-5' exonuclease PolX
MSATKTRLTLFEARAMALRALELLAPSCDRIQVAGSIRRRRPEIGDIELVCIPSIASMSQPGLFGEQVEIDTINLLDAACREFLEDGTFTHRLDKNGRRAFGSKYKRLAFEGVGLDLFSVLAPAQFGVVYLIRTGSAEFSHRLVTPQYLGGWMSFAHYVKDGALWCGGALLETPEEHDVFAAINRPYVDPWEREL